MFDAKNYQHSHNWVTNSELRRNLRRFLPPIEPATSLRMLEVGTFEGLMACYFSDELLDHPDARLHCVDPFDLSDTTTELTDDTESRFRANIAQSKNATKITIYKMYSRDFYAIQRMRPNQTELYDFIYIDGSHLPNDIITDMQECYSLLKPGGIMWMDDYCFGNDGSVKRAMDYALQSLTGFRIIHKDYQLAIQKHT